MPFADRQLFPTCRCLYTGTFTYTHRLVYTQKLLHTGSFTHRHFYTQKLLHTHTQTHTHTLWLLPRTLLHTEARTHTHTPKKNTPRKPFMQKLLHADAFAHRKLLHANPFTRRCLYAQMFLRRMLLHTDGVTHFYAQMLGDTGAFTHRSSAHRQVYTENAFTHTADRVSSLLRELER